MATPKLITPNITGAWADVIGSVANTANIEWQNQGPDSVLIAFTTAQPGPTDAYFTLRVFDSYMDETGSAHIWAKSVGSIGAVLTANQK